MATPRLGLVVEDKPTELSCNFPSRAPMYQILKGSTILMHAIFLPGKRPPGQYSKFMIKRSWALTRETTVVN